MTSQRLFESGQTSSNPRNMPPIEDAGARYTVAGSFHGAIYTCRQGSANGWSPLADGYIPIRVLENADVPDNFKVVAASQKTGEMLEFDVVPETRARRTKPTFLQWHVKGSRLNYGVQLVNEAQAAKFQELLQSAIDAAKAAIDNRLKDLETTHRLTHLSRTGQYTEAFQILNDKALKRREGPGAAKLVIKVLLPHNQSTVISVAPETTLQQVVLLVSSKRKLDPNKFGIRNQKRDRLYRTKELKATAVGSIGTNEVKMEDLSTYIDQPVPKADKLALLATHAPRHASGDFDGENTFLQVHLPDGCSTMVKLPRTTSMGELLFYIAEKRAFDPADVELAESAAGKKLLSMKGSIGDAKRKDVYIVSRSSRQKKDRASPRSVRRGRSKSKSPKRQRSASNPHRLDTKTGGTSDEQHRVISLLAEGVDLQDIRMPTRWTDLFCRASIAKKVVHDPRERAHIFAIIEKCGGVDELLRYDDSYLRKLFESAGNFRRAKTIKQTGRKPREGVVMRRQKTIEAEEDAAAVARKKGPGLNVIQSDRPRRKAPRPPKSASAELLRNMAGPPPLRPPPLLADDGPVSSSAPQPTLLRNRSAAAAMTLQSFGRSDSFERPMSSNFDLDLTNASSTGSGSPLRRRKDSVPDPLDLSGSASSSTASSPSKSPSLVRRQPSDSRPPLSPTRRSSAASSAPSPPRPPSSAGNNEAGQGDQFRGRSASASSSARGSMRGSRPRTASAGSRPRTNTGSSSRSVPPPPVPPPSEPSGPNKTGSVRRGTLRLESNEPAESSADESPQQPSRLTKPGSFPITSPQRSVLTLQQASVGATDMDADIGPVGIPLRPAKLGSPEKGEAPRKWRRPSNASRDSDRRHSLEKSAARKLTLEQPPAGVRKVTLEQPPGASRKLTLEQPPARKDTLVAFTAHKDSLEVAPARKDTIEVAPSPTRKGTLENEPPSERKATLQRPPLPMHTAPPLPSSDKAKRRQSDVPCFPAPAPPGAGTDDEAGGDRDSLDLLHSEFGFGNESDDDTDIANVPAAARAPAGHKTETAEPETPTKEEVPGATLEDEGDDAAESPEPAMPPPPPPPADQSPFRMSMGSASSFSSSRSNSLGPSSLGSNHLGSSPMGSSPLAGLPSAPSPLASTTTALSENSTKAEAEAPAKPEKKQPPAIKKKPASYKKKAPLPVPKSKPPPEPAVPEPALAPAALPAPVVNGLPSPADLPPPVDGSDIIPPPLSHSSSRSSMVLLNDLPPPPLDDDLPPPAVLDLPDVVDLDDLPPPPPMDIASLPPPALDLPPPIFATDEPLPPPLDDLPPPLDAPVASADVTSRPTKRSSLAAVCASCNAVLLPGLRFCGECGTAVGSECLSCGFAMLPKAKFCGSCGAAAGVTLPPPMDLEPPPPPPPEAPPPPSASMLVGRQGSSFAEQLKRNQKQLRKSSTDAGESSGGATKRVSHGALGARDALLYAVKRASKESLKSADARKLAPRLSEPRDELLAAVRKSSKDILKKAPPPQPKEPDQRSSLLDALRTASNKQRLKKVSVDVSRKKGEVKLDTRSQLMVSLGAMGQARSKLRKTVKQSASQKKLRRLNSMQSALNRALSMRRGVMDDAGEDDEEWEDE